MKKLLLLTAVFTTVAAMAQKATSVKQLLWLEGSWKNDKTGNVETWRPVNDTTLGGISTHKDDDGEALVDEVIRIVQRGNTFYYIPLVPDQNKGKEVEFKVVAFTAKSFTAENPAHDFPQRITYQLKDATHLYATIQGKQNGKSKQIEFYFTKTQ